MAEDSSIMVAVSLSDHEEEVEGNPVDVKVEHETEVMTEAEASPAASQNGELDVDEMQKRIYELEQERGQLTAELMTKDQLVSNLEKETSSLKAEVAHLESSHTNVIAEHERKFLQMSEDMGAKVTEVNNIY